MSERRSWRGPAAIGGLLALVGVVAVAAAGGGPGLGTSAPGGHPPTLIADYIGTLALLFVPAGAILIVWMTFMRKSYEVRTGTKLKLGRLYFIVFALLVAALLFSATHFGWRSRSKDIPRINPLGGLAKNRPTRPGQYQPHFQWFPVFIIGSLVLGFGGTAGVLALRRRRHGLPPMSVEVAVAQALGETLDDLRNEPDPRKAVIGAYARMERALAARGVPRQAFEAPLEYLVRVLDFVQASGHSVRRLTQLFERARFSPHEIDAGMKEDAIAALSGLRAELEAAR
ncbi:MAG: DUF4129 domain-containing protein [Actinobacteria bacterium]|nr:MAG: DUF4129 domain-containing protein [Actinomycetota bacterium]